MTFRMVSNPNYSCAHARWLHVHELVEFDFSALITKQFGMILLLLSKLRQTRILLSLIVEWGFVCAGNVYRAQFKTSICQYTHVLTD